MQKLKVHFKIDNHRLFINTINEKGDFKLPEYINEEYSHQFQIGETSLFLSTENSDENWVELQSIERFGLGHGRFVLHAISRFYSFMPEGVEGFLNYIPREFLKTRMREKILAHSLNEITFYGGSFNPWHEGHSECLRQCPAEDIVIIPDSNPWKGPKNLEDNQICLWQSFREIVNKFQDSRFSLFPGFWILERTNPTVQWLPDVQIARKNFLMGDDNFFSLHKWTGVEKLMSSLSTIYVVPRLYKKQEIEEFKENFQKQFEVDVNVLSEHDFQNLSSTQIRGQNL